MDLRQVKREIKFQSTRPRGARLSGNAWPLHSRSFNPRAREGRDFRRFMRSLSFVLVSIHAPARGATCVGASILYFEEFQSTRPRGARRSCSSSKRRSFNSFNPRAREGRDLRSPSLSFTIFCFNPRAREGRDVCFRVHTHITNVSIHAPARGATCRDQAQSIMIACFNPRAREGRDFSERFSFDFLRVSIHAPARGATAGNADCVPQSVVSIHAPARGATPRRLWTRSPAHSVSIHAPARGATS